MSGQNEVDALSVFGDVYEGENIPSFMKKRVWKKVFAVLVNPEYDSDSIQKKSEIAGVHYHTVRNYLADDEFMAFVREKRLKIRTMHLVKCDEILLNVAETSSNDNARINAVREIMKRWDPDYEDKAKIDVNINFSQMMKKAYEKIPTANYREIDGSE
jgi:hypothetical protein